MGRDCKSGTKPFFQTDHTVCIKFTEGQFARGMTGLAEFPTETRSEYKAVTKEGLGGF